MLVLLAVFFHPPWKILLVPLMIASLAVIIIITLFAFFFFIFASFTVHFPEGWGNFSLFCTRAIFSHIFGIIYFYLIHHFREGASTVFFLFSSVPFWPFSLFTWISWESFFFLRYFAHFQYIAQFSLEWMFITVIFLVYPWFLYPKWLFINRKWVLFGWHNSIYGISLIFRLNSINSFISHLFLFALSIGDGNKIYWINSIFRQFPHAIGIHIFVLHSWEFA